MAYDCHYEPGGFQERFMTAKKGNRYYALTEAKEEP